MKTVTIVDDNIGLRFLLSELLEGEMGIRCLGTESLEDTVAHGSEVLKSDLVVLDINLGMGQPDGVAVYRWLKEQNYSGRLFFLSGHAANSPFVKEAAQTGIQILEKPMTADELVFILKDSLASERFVAHAN